MEGAGVAEVNGEYYFRDIKCNAGYYCKRGIYDDKECNFTLYKCSLRNGGYQWFMSITPEDHEPGTSKDIDFYYAQAKLQDTMPPKIWNRLTGDHTRDPAPRVKLIYPTNDYDSDSDKESSVKVTDETALDDSFASYN